MRYKLEQNPDKYTWVILESNTSGRLQFNRIQSFGPEYGGESHAVIENRARRALKQLEDAARAQRT